ncbi:MAG: hypothetical protein AB7K52_01525 [Phycisphaerales bacterium]
MSVRIALACAVMSSASCVTEGPPPRDPPRPIPAQPEGIQATAMSFNVGTYTTDDDGNGFVDTFDATVYLFNEQYAFALSLPGSLRFTLADREGRPLARWTFDETQAAALRRDLPPGPGYLVRLSLLNVGGDSFEKGVAELSCEFVPANGLVVRSKGARPVRIGNVR